MSETCTAATPVSREGTKAPPGRRTRARRMSSSSSVLKSGGDDMSYSTGDETIFLKQNDSPPTSVAAAPPTTTTTTATTNTTSTKVVSFGDDVNGSGRAWSVASRSISPFQHDAAPVAVLVRGGAHHACTGYSALFPTCYCCSHLVLHLRRPPAWQSACGPWNDRERRRRQSRWYCGGRVGGAG